MAVFTDTATVNVEPPSIVMTKTVGLDPGLCAATDEITVTRGTEVTYCYQVENTGNITLTLHDLTDSALGALLTGYVYDLLPGASVFVTQSTAITQTTANTATWTAYNEGPVDMAVYTDTAKVNVEPPSILLTKTVGLDSGVCAATDEITVTRGTEVTYCYQVENTGAITLTLHDLTDSALGALLTGYPTTSSRGPASLSPTPLPSPRARPIRRPGPHTTRGQWMSPSIPTRRRSMSSRLPSC